jgi:rhodanese-related sulfurtransferase
MTKEELLKSKPAEIIVVDIREDYEVSESPLPFENLHVPMSRLVESVGKNELPKDKIIVTVCLSGARCLAVNHFLEANGYKVDYLEGGIINW